MSIAMALQRHLTRSIYNFNNPPACMTTLYHTIFPSSPHGSPTFVVPVTTL